MQNRSTIYPIIAREGWPIIGAGVIATLAFLVLDWELLAFLAFVFLVFSLNFFRDPIRPEPEDPRDVVSPVDGRVCKVQKAVNPETGEEAIQISIFMNVFDVHSQKAPVAGVIEKITYTPGLFLSADLDKASTDNERNAITVRTPEGRTVTFIQVAGLVARRIICHAAVGQTLRRGERYGFIRFGSRVDVYLPLEAEVKCVIGERVAGVLSTIAKL